MAIAVIIGPRERERIKKLRSFAERKKNWFTPGDEPPGDNPKHVVTLPSQEKGIFWRCVFSISLTTNDEIKVRIPVRHLSMSLVGAPKNRIPAPWTLEWVGKEFGIDCPREDYVAFGLHPIDGAFHIAAPYIAPGGS